MRLTIGAVIMMGAGLWLTGCDKVAETAAKHVDESEMKAQFVGACGTESAKASGGLASEVQMTQVCTCAYDEVAKQYSDKEVWKKAIIQYGMGNNESGVEEKLITAMTTCATQLIPQH